MTISIKHDLPREEYFIDPVNSQDNERIVELKLAMDWYEKVFNAGRADNILEIGNVLGFYGFSDHECIDKFAALPDISPAGTVDNVDALEYDYTGRDVICVSTIEHMGMTDYDNPTPNEGQDAITALDKIHNEASTYFITFGAKYNTLLDEYVKNNLDRYDWHGWVRTGRDKFDYTAQDMAVWDKGVDDPFPFSNSIILLQKGQ